MPARSHHRRVPHRDPGDVLNGDRLRVVTQQIRRRPTHLAQRRVQAGDQAAHRLIPDRDHHPKPGPGQPRAEQIRLAAADPRTVTPVELQPQAGLGHPWPIRAPPPRPPHVLRLANRPPRGAFRAGEPHRDQPLVHLVRADLRLRHVDELFHLRQERVDQLRPRRRAHQQRIPATGIPQRHVPTHRLRVTPRQLRCGMRTARRVVRLQNLHDLPVRLGHGLSGSSVARSATGIEPAGEIHIHVAETEIT